MLSEFQRRIARLALTASPDPDLVLAGGAALIEQGLVDRNTMDLDFFTTSPRVEELVDVLAAALAGEELTIRRERVTPTFARLVVADGSERCPVDVAQDFRLLPPVPTELGPALSGEELAADKTLTLFSRAEPRDFVDVFFLARRYGKHRLLELAREKDLGFDEVAFAGTLGAIGRLDRAEFDVDDTTYVEIHQFVEAWLDELESAT